MRKLVTTILGLMLAMVMTLSLAACGGGTKPGVDAEGNVTKITMWAGGQWVGNDYKNLSTFINKYNAIKPDGFEIALEGKSDLETSFASALRSGSQPDIMIWDRFNTPTYVGNDFLCEIDDLIASDKVDTTKFHSEAMKELKYESKTYGLPLDLDTWGIYVNMDLVDEYNKKAENAGTQITISSDWTWDDLYSIAVKLKTVCDAGYSTGDLEEHLFKFSVSAGTDIVKDGKTNFNTTETTDILNFFKKLKQANVGGTQEKGSFPSGKIAMINNPTYYSGYIKEQNPTMNFKFMPQPRYSKNGTAVTTGVNGGMIGGYGIAYPKPSARNKTKEWEAKHKAAWSFTKWWLTSEENMLDWAKTSGTLPALTSTYENAFIKDNPTLADASKYVDDYKIRPQVKGYLQLQTNVINTTLKRFLSSEIDVAKTIELLTSAGNKELS